MHFRNITWNSLKSTVSFLFNHWNRSLMPCDHVIFLHNLLLRCVMPLWPAWFIVIHQLSFSILVNHHDSSWFLYQICVSSSISKVNQVMHLFALSLFWKINQLRSFVELCAHLRHFWFHIRGQIVFWLISHRIQFAQNLSSWNIWG